MSDLREAFEALARIGNYASVPFELMTQFADDVDTIKAALQSQTAPAVPEGFDVRRNSDGDIIVTRLSDGGSAAYSKESPMVTVVMGWHFLDAMLTAAPQPDHSPDAGKVEQNHECFFVDGQKNGVRGQYCLLCNRAAPAVSENEVKAQALEAYARDLDQVHKSAKRQHAYNTPAWYAGSFAKDARAAAARLRGDKGVE